MPIPSGPPSDGLEYELAEVRDKANLLKQALNEGAGPNAPLPPDFPREALLDITAALANLPAGTAEGCRPVLTHARLRLPAIRREFFPAGLKGDAKLDETDAPTPTRGGSLDRRLASLIASVTTALDEYRRIAVEEIEDVEEPEQSVTLNEKTTINEAIGESRKLETKLGEMRDIVAEAALPNSAKPDLISREIADAENINREARAELRMKKIAPGWLQGIGSALRKTPAAIRKSVDAAQVGVDIAEIAHDRWHHFWGNVWKFGFKEVRETLDSIGKVLGRLEAAKKPPRATAPPPDFSLDQAHAMILRGEAPPVAWRPWIEALDFQDEEKLKEIRALAASTSCSRSISGARRSRTLRLWPASPRCSRSVSGTP